MKAIKMFWRLIFLVGLVLLMGTATDMGDTRTMLELFKQLALGLVITVVSFPPMLRSLPKELFN